MPDREERPHDVNVIAWRLSALEEAMRYQTTQIEKFGERQQELRNEIAEIRHDYVGREELRKETRERDDDNRDVWTLRLLALGTAANMALGIFAIVHH